MFIRWLWEIATPSYRALRAKYGLEGEWGILLTDSFGGYAADEIRSEIERWSKANCCHIMGLTWGPKVPGGWSAPGQPNDAFHQFIHMIRRGYERITVSYEKNVLLRTALARDCAC